MPAVITFTEGTYRNMSVVGKQFEMVEDYRSTLKGGHVTVVNNNAFPGRPHQIRVRVLNESSYTLISGTLPAAAEPDGVMSFAQDEVNDSTVAHETDEEIVERLRIRFNVLTEMTKAVRAGNVRAMIVSGPPGVGKSFGVEEVLGKDDFFDALGDRKPRYEFVKGAMSALGLYSKLYEFSESKNVLVFDDCDSVLFDDLSLNILKAALDTSKKRTISWNTDSRMLSKEGIPNSFEFKGSAIFITNIKFEHIRSKKLQDHLAALESRCHYIDLQMSTQREKILRIRQIVEDGMLDSYDFEPEEIDEVVEFIATNKSQLRELSLRTVLKVSDLRKSFPTTWKDMAAVTVMRKA
jgi:hypothetical protein